VLISVTALYAQKHPNSVAYKDYKRPDTASIFKRVDDSFRLWQSYLLVREANNGNPLAQHEVGLRYLTGNGFKADTVKAFYWIKKAADQNLKAANYNLGILYNNGWGTEWNPFNAFKRFSKAAKDSMPEAIYVLGLLYTDNLIVPKNYEKAFRYVAKASEMKYKPADEILLEFYKRGIGEVFDTNFAVRKSHMKDSVLFGQDITDPAENITFLNYEKDSLKNDDLTLLKEVLRDGSNEMRDALGVELKNDSTFTADSSVIFFVKQAADYGSPEALVMFGRCYEKGIVVTKDLVTAAMYYLRAMRLESPRAPLLLWELVQNKEFISQLKKKLDQKNSDAQFVDASLFILGIDNTLNEKVALKMLEDSANKNNLAALVELGFLNQSGSFIDVNKEKALALWKKAKKNGSKEAEIRILMAQIQANDSESINDSLITKLKFHEQKGSLLAQMMLAYIYENGLGIQKNKPEAVHYYRICAQRGNRGAQRSLKRLYDEIRPGEQEFIVLD